MCTLIAYRGVHQQHHPFPAPPRLHVIPPNDVEAENNLFNTRDGRIHPLVALFQDYVDCLVITLEIPLVSGGRTEASDCNSCKNGKAGELIHHNISILHPYMHWACLLVGLLVIAGFLRVCVFAELHHKRTYNNIPTIIGDDRHGVCRKNTTSLYMWHVAHQNS